MVDHRPFPPGYDPRKDKIELVAYDPNWPKLFLKEKKVLQKALKKFPKLRVEHIGSTSVPDMAAKPILDMLLSVQTPEMWPKLVEPLRELGYYYWGSHEEEMLFIKGLPPLGKQRTHHLHICEFEGVRWKKETAFRDHLKNDPEEAAAYEKLKRLLAKEYTYNREGYTKGKNSYIQKVLKKISHG